MKIEKIKPGMTLYDVGRTKMGNTNISTVRIWTVSVISVDLEKRSVRASWNGNLPRDFFEYSWRKWRLKEPMTITTFMGRRRLATRAEIAESKARSRTP